MPDTTATAEGWWSGLSAELLAVLLGFVDEIADTLAGIFKEAATEALAALRGIGIGESAADIAGAVAGGTGTAGLGGSLGLDFDYLDAMAEKYGIERGGELVGMKWDGIGPKSDIKSWIPNPNAKWSISETTRERMNALLQEAMQEGWSPQRFGEALKPLFDEARADMIARTEVAIAQNRGQVQTYQAAGVTHVYVFDGDEDAECAEANGSTWTVEEALENPIEHPNAIFEGTKVVTIGGVSVGYRAKWSGPARRIVTAGQKRLTISANHPVLTGRGWVAAKNVREGDNVVCRLDREAITLPLDAYLYQRPAAVEDIFGAALRSGTPTTISATRAHFHDDRNFCEGEIDVVLTDGQLTGEWDAPAHEHRRELVFSGTTVASNPLSRERALVEDVGAIALPAPGSMAFFDMGRVGEPGADGDHTLFEPVSEATVADATFTRELTSRFAVNVALDEVIEVGDVEAFSSHAFDLSTGHHTYFASDILVHNCVRSFSPKEIA